MDETIFGESCVGKRLKKIKKIEKSCLVFNGEKISVVKKVLIGRNKSCGVNLDDALVSRKHAEVQVIKGVYYIRDLGSKNGTFVNNQLVPNEKYIKLKKLDKIRIGKNIIFIQ